MYIALGISLGIVMLVFLLSYIGFNAVFRAPKRGTVDIYRGLDGEETEQKKESRAAITRLKDSTFESVTAMSFDKKMLFGRYFHRSESAITVIAFHGYKSAGVRDMARISIEFEKRGYNLLLVDQRSHGESGGNIISFGAKEKYDALAWVNYINSRFETSKILLYGISMGAATVLMASELVKNKNVFGIIADCSYSTPSAIIKHVTKNRNLPATVLFPFIRLGGILFGHFDVKRHSALRAVEKTDIPILLIHGEADNFVPPSMSDEIYSAGKAKNKNISILKIPEAPHTLAIMFDTEGYMKEVSDFIKTNTEEKERK